jgi:anti-sigma factor ChrR (cupin superfamily)
LAYEHGAELFVIDGEFSDEGGNYAKGSWLRMPAGSAHHPSSASGCMRYVKTGGLAYLISGIS